MVEQHPIAIIGNLLQLPNLEEQTVKDVNQALRSMIVPYIRAKPPDEPNSADPFTQAQQAAMAFLGSGVYEEWTEGKVKQDG
ncbi:hypothetical protein [Paenibacillus wynnii]|uniref:Uncharacterized protein n=1 Tax=Paenibacillus wynnii TaxID=268407 RepID=A0A098MET4_9BACL|nr:hypothetical protein [Paenibacillus wynnii]KGE20052.1 hypothetical protein PWYN_12420 [Paenibacillus wynnii]